MTKYKIYHQLLRTLIKKLRKKYDDDLHAVHVSSRNAAELWFQLAGYPAIFTIPLQFRIQPKCYMALDILLTYITTFRM